MATSVASGASSFAVLPMGTGTAFWEVFARTGASVGWKLVTPPGAADNGGLVVSVGAADSLSVAVRPSQDLEFSPVAQTADNGGSWTVGGPVGGAVAASPDSFAAVNSDLVTLLSNGTVETSPDAGTSWSTIAKPGAIAASPAAKGCGGAVALSAVAFGVLAGEVLAGGTCGSGGASALFSYVPGSGWQRLTLPVSGQLVQLTSGTVLVRGKSGLSVAWTGFSTSVSAAGATPSPPPAAGLTQWTASTPLAVSGAVTASGLLAPGSPWVLLSGGHAAALYQGQQWRELPVVPAGTSVLASGPGGAIDALAVSGTTVTAWRLGTGASSWSKVQALSVPIQYGSSS